MKEYPFTIGIKGQLKNQDQIQFFSNNHDNFKCWDLASYTMTIFCTYLMALIGSKFFNSSIMFYLHAINITMKLISRDYLWPHFWNYVKRFITWYDICAWTKKNCMCIHGFLQPLLILTLLWSLKYMDFIMNIPSFNSYNVILIMVDHLIKMVHLILWTKTIIWENKLNKFLIIFLVS